MRGFIALIAVGLLVSACSTTDELKPADRGQFIALKNVSYDQVWQAANKVMSRRFRIIEADAEVGSIRGLSGSKKHDWDVLFWRESVGLFVWPTESNDFGYTVDIDSQPGYPLVFVDSLSVPVDSQVENNWKQILIKELKKELGAS